MNKDLLSNIKDGSILTWKTHQILPSLVGAQAILESGWGKSELAVNANNLFGVKADKGWKGEKYNVPTKEFIDNEWIVVNADFRKYKDWNESVNDHANFFVENDFRKNNYRHLIGEKDYTKAVKAILKPIAEYGYATDPDYADKIIRIIEENKLHEWDKIAFGEDLNNGKEDLIMAIVSSHAGHGGAKINGRWADSGAVGNGSQEATIARTINDKIIKATGAKDTTDNRGRDANAILYNTVANINSCGGGYQISNHLNAFGQSSANGVEVLYGDIADKPMAEKVSKAIADATGMYNRGAKDGSWLYIASNSGWDKKVLLIEWGFITNTGDMKKLGANMDKGINAMLKCFGYNVNVGGGTTPSKPNPTPTPKPTTYEIVNRTKSDARVGKTVSVASYATAYATGQSINQSVVKGKKYKIIEKGTRKNDGKNSYLLEGIMSWVLEQDIPEFKSNPTPTPSNDTIYTVVPNDTLWGISRKYGTTVDQLKAWNGLKSDILIVGKKLIVKKGVSNGFNINNYHTTTPKKIKMVKEDWAYAEASLKTKKEKMPKNVIYTVVRIVYSGQYPRYELKSGLFVTTRKDTVTPV